MKVLFIINIPPPYGGGEVVNQEIYDNLKDRYYYSLRWKNSLISKSIQGKITFHNIIDGIKLIAKSMIAILRIRPDVIFISVAKDFPAFIRDSLIILYSMLFRIKVIGDLHGMTLYFLDSPWKKSYALMILNKITSLRVLSNSIMLHLREQGISTNIRVIDNGITDPAKYLPTIQSQRRISSLCKILYLGAISEEKGFSQVLSVINSLGKAGINYELNVVGQWIDDDYMEYCMEKIHNDRLDDKIIFHGLLVANEKLKVVAECDIMLMLSKNEGQPIAIIESIALGIPVIAAGVGAIPEMINNGKDGYVIKNCLEEAPAIISRLISSPGTYTSLSENARKLFLQRFTIDKYIQNIESLIKDCNKYY